MATTAETLLAELSRLGLLSPEDLETFLQELPPEAHSENPARLTDELVRRHKLTGFQAEALLRGNGSALRVGNYIVLDKLGSGGMGTVYKARHIRIERLVALKVLSGSALTSSSGVQRFHREVEAVARLAHPNIVAALDAGQAGETHFLVMELVHGRDLARTVRERGPLAIRDAVEYTVQTAAGLSEAHGRGIIHRDIKPANLLVDETGVVKILDMGLARFDDQLSVEALSLESESTGLTQTGAIMGTIDYMAPEQAVDIKHADARSDVYSLGCTLYFLLTGRTVYGGDTLMKKLLAHREAPIPSVRVLRPEVHPGLDAILRRMLAKDPSDRQPTAKAVIEELTRWQQQSSPEFGSQDTIALSQQRMNVDDSRAETVQVGRAQHSPPTVNDLPSKFDSGLFHKPPLPQRPPLDRRWIIGGLVLLASVIGTGWLVSQRSPRRRSTAVATVPQPTPETKVATTPTAKVEEQVPQAIAQLPPLPFGDPSTRKLPGLATETPKIPNIGRWQVDIADLRNGAKCVAWSPDRRHVVVGGHYGDLRIYDTVEWKRVQILIGHTTDIVDVAWNPEGSRIASIDFNGEVRLWHADGHPGPILPGNHEHVVAWSPDGRWLGVGAVDHAELWTSEGKLVRSFPLQQGKVRDLAFSADSRQIVSAAGRFLKIWNLDGTPGDRTIDFDHLTELLAVAWSQRGTIAAIAKTDLGNSVYLHRVNDDAEPRIACRRGTWLAWNPAGDQLAISGERSVAVVNSDGSILIVEQDLGGGQFVDWTSDGQKLAFCIGKAVGIWEPFGELSLHPAYLEEYAVDLHPDGQRLTTAHVDGLRFWSPTGVVEQRVALDIDSPSSIRWSHDGRTLAIGVQHVVGTWTAEAGYRQLFQLDSGSDYTTRLAWSPDDKRLATGSCAADSLVYTVDGKLAGRLPHQAEFVRLVDWSSTGQLATGDHAMTVHFWKDDGTAGVVADLKDPGSTGYVTSLVWSPDAKILAVGTYSYLGQHRVRLLDANGKSQKFFDVSYGIQGLAWNPAGDRLAIALDNGDIELRTAAGKLERVIVSGGKHLTAVWWSKDNRLLALTNPDQLLRCWTADQGQPQWSALVLRNGASLTFDHTGKLANSSGNSAEKSVVYLVERDHGRVELLPPQAFESLRKTADVK